MAAWTELVEEFGQQPDDESRKTWLYTKLNEVLGQISAKRGGKNVLYYSSAFLQKPQVPAYQTQLTYEEINGFMSCMYGMTWDRGLSLLLHTPGGMTNAAETVVQYLHSKFSDIEVIVPAFAMSAGTMISLSANRILMGRQSQLGPIDPQLSMGGRSVSARAVVDQFEKAKSEIIENQMLAHAWAPILQSLGPSLLVEAQNALDYGERMVANWLESRMFAGQHNARINAAKTAKHFNDATNHKSHGRRINRDEARQNGVVVEDLEDDQELQDAVLTAYHLGTILYEQTPAVKLIWGNTGQVWLKNA